MTSIRIRIDSTLSPERLLFAARDLSPRRCEVFPAVRAEHFVVHAAAGTSADVTEGTPFMGGVNWERCDYDWSAPDRVIATVTDSNVYAVPGSAWEFSATPTDSGSKVEMVWTRKFRRSARGVFFAPIFNTIGWLIFRSYAREVVHNVEHLEQLSRRS